MERGPWEHGLARFVSDFKHSINDIGSRYIERSTDVPRLTSAAALRTMPRARTRVATDLYRAHSDRRALEPSCRLRNRAILFT